MSCTTGQKTSPKRQHGIAEFQLLAKHLCRNSIRPQHQHQTGQLIFALRGTMLIDTPQSRWTIPPQRALWVPSQHPHSIHMLSDVEMRTVYFHSDLIAQIPNFARSTEVHAVVASPLIKELILGLFLRLEDAEMSGLMATLLLHALRDTVCLPTHLPMPLNEKLRNIVMAQLSENNWHIPASDLAARVAMSERTFARRFSDEVGFSYRSWRQRARIIASLDLLEKGRSVKSIANAMQFSSAAAYISAFRKILGSTPLSFQQDNEERTRRPSK